MTSPNFLPCSCFLVPHVDNFDPSFETPDFTHATLRDDTQSFPTFVDPAVLSNRNVPHGHIPYTPDLQVASQPTLSDLVPTRFSSDYEYSLPTSNQEVDSMARFSDSSGTTSFQPTLPAYSTGSQNIALDEPPLVSSSFAQTDLPPEVKSDIDHPHRCRCSTAGSFCDHLLNGSIPHIRRHLKQAHNFRATGKKLQRCPWSGCNQVLRSENICRHIVSCHLRIKVRCSACGMELSRKDVKYTHRKSCPGGAPKRASAMYRTIFTPF